MQRRVFSREFKLEAVKLIKDRGVAVAQAARDLGVAESVLRRWVREGGVDPRHLRWSPKTGQVVKLGSPQNEDGPDDGHTETLQRGFQSESCS